MGRVIDKLLIISFLIIAMYNHIHGNYLLVFIYGAITFAAINIYLFDIKERSIISKPKGIMEICAYILQIACILLVVPFPVVIYMMPLCIYDACQERNLVVWVLAFINSLFLSNNAS